MLKHFVEYLSDAGIQMDNFVNTSRNTKFISDIENDDCKNLPIEHLLKHGKCTFVLSDSRRYTNSEQYEIEEVVFRGKNRFFLQNIIIKCFLFNGVPFIVNICYVGVLELIYAQEFTYTDEEIKEIMDCSEKTVLKNFNEYLYDKGISLDNYKLEKVEDLYSISIQNDMNNPATIDQLLKYDNYSFIINDGRRFPLMSRPSYNVAILEFSHKFIENAKLLCIVYKNVPIVAYKINSFDDVENYIYFKYNDNEIKEILSR